MKRSPMRKPYVRPERVLPAFPATPPVPKAVMMSANETPLVQVPKETVLRSEAYRRWVASLPCIACGIVGYSQACHSNDNRRRGLGMKASDQYLFALCCTRPGHMGHHFEHDNCIGMTKEQRRELEAAYVAKTQALAVEAGWCVETLTRKA